jgi:hypothetical protein
MISQKEEMRTGTESSGVVLHDMIERIYFYFIIFSQKRNGKRETHGRRGSSRGTVHFRHMGVLVSTRICTKVYSEESFGDLSILSNSIE